MKGIIEALAGTDGTIRLGEVERVDEAGTPWVRLPCGRSTAARWLVGLTHEQLRVAQAAGTPVILALIGRSEAVILGVLADPGSPARAEAVVDGKKVAVTGEEEVTLRCGKASITLTRAGKVLIKGDYVLSRASGVNRIKGGAVQIN
jgi:hypothetical protein